MTARGVKSAEEKISICANEKKTSVRAQRARKGYRRVLEICTLNTRTYCQKQRTGFGVRY
jgi:hypothetical protein